MGVPKNFATSTEKHLIWSLVLPATLLKRGSKTGVFLWISQNFQEPLFLENTSGGWFWANKKAFLCARSETRQKVKRSFENNLNRNAETIPLGFFCKISVLEILTIFTKKPSYGWVSILIKLHGSTLQVLKKETPAQIFSYEFCEVFIEHLFGRTCAIICFLK